MKTTKLMNGMKAARRLGLRPGNSGELRKVLARNGIDVVQEKPWARGVSLMVLPMQVTEAKKRGIVRMVQQREQRAKVAPVLPRVKATAKLTSEPPTTLPMIVLAGQLRRIANDLVEVGVKIEQVANELEKKACV